MPIIVHFQVKAKKLHIPKQSNSHYCGYTAFEKPSEMYMFHHTSCCAMRSLVLKSQNLLTANGSTIKSSRNLWKYWFLLGFTVRGSVHFWLCGVFPKCHLLYPVRSAVPTGYTGKTINWLKRLPLKTPFWNMTNQGVSVKTAVKRMNMKQKQLHTREVYGISLHTIW